VRTKNEFLPPEPFLCFSQRTCPIHYFRSRTHVWGGFVQFHSRTSPIPKTGVVVHTKHEFSPPEPFLRFSQRTCPIHYFRSRTHVWGGFVQFRSRTSPIPKTGVGVHTKHEFSLPEPFLRFSQRTCPIHYFRSKTHVWGGFAQFRCRTSPIPKTGVGCIQSMSFRHQNHFFVFRKEHAESTTLGPKLMFGVVSRNFVVVRHPIPKTGVGVHTKHEFLPPEPILRFSQRTCTIHYFRSKTHVWGGFAPHVTHSENGCRGAYKARVFATGTISSFFATNMPNPLL
jgi:RNA polymerase subunit RPABC4/transcription elongation factor Spt4